MNYRNEQWLRAKYVHEQRTIKELANLAGVTSPAISYWMKRFKIERRTLSQALKGKYAGTKAHFYGKKHSKATRAKIAKNHHNVSGTRNPMYGKSGPAAPGYRRMKSAAERKKLSAALKGRTRPEMVGAKNPQWKGGKTSLAARIRVSSRGVEWRTAVYARDKYTCQKCGDNRGGNLNAHHVVRLAVLLDQYEVRTLRAAYRCKQLWDVANGVTLCEHCHDGHHSTVSSRGA